MSHDVKVYIDASGAFPELVRRDQVRGLLVGLGGIRRLNGPPAAIVVGRTKHGRPIALEVNLATLVVAVNALREAYGLDDAALPEPETAVQ